MSVSKYGFTFDSAAAARLFTSEIGTALLGLVDVFRWDPKRDAIVATRSFYYTHGTKAEDIAKDIQERISKRLGVTVTIQAAERHDRRWPRLSVWRVIFTLAPAPVQAEGVAHG